MIVMSGSDAYKQLYSNIRRKSFNMPSKTEVGSYVDGGIFPKFASDFQISPGSKIFTIGSCFAREVEAVLLDCDYVVPVAGFDIPEPELPFPGPHLLNEYNAGTIAQRLEASSGNFDYGEKGIEFTEKGCIDLFLHVGSTPVSLERLLQRRRQIGELYRDLLTSDVVIITLGLVESWYDTQDQCYLNRAPSAKLVRASGGRYAFHRMDLESIHARIDRGVKLLLAAGMKHIIMTVSPIPVEATFMPESCPIANGYSKAVLRVCADLISKRYDQVTYFPSLEIVNSFGTSGYLDDNVHVQPFVVHHIMHYFLQCFRGAAAPDGEAATPLLEDAAVPVT